MERARLDCVARPTRAGLRRATSWSLRGLCLAGALALPSGCGEDEALAPVLDADRLGDLSGAQLKSLCEEGEALQDTQGADRCDSELSYAVITAEVASCDDSLPAPCDVTAGELRACRRAALADPCNERPAETAAACAPLIQRGCAEEDPWRGLCSILHDITELNAQNQGFVDAFLSSFPGTEEVKGRFAFEVPNKGKLKGFVWVWMERVTRTYPHTVWLNPVAQRHWDYSESTTIIRRLLANRMYPITIEGLENAMKELVR